MRATSLKLALAWGIVAVVGLAAVGADDYRFTSSLIQTVPTSGPTRLRVDNPVGNVSIEIGQEGAIDLFAVRKASSEVALAQISVTIEQGEGAVLVRASEPERVAVGWAVDLVLRVPAGTELDVSLGVGDLALRDYVGCASVQVGTGSLRIDGFAGLTFSANVGVGDAAVIGLSCDWGHLDVGVGNLDLRLAADASYTVTAEVGMGNATIQGFPGMQLEMSGFLGKDARAILGGGAGTLQLNVGVGNLFLRSVPL